MSENNDLVATDTMLSIQDGTCLGCSDVGFQGFNTWEKKDCKGCYNIEWWSNMQMMLSPTNLWIEVKLGLPVWIWLDKFLFHIYSFAGRCRSLPGWHYIFEARGIPEHNLSLSTMASSGFASQHISQDSGVSTSAIGSMYGIFTYLWLNFTVNIGKYTIHGSLRTNIIDKTIFVPTCDMNFSFWQ